jgi:hypothetical protein
MLVKKKNARACCFFSPHEHAHAPQALRSDDHDNWFDGPPLLTTAIEGQRWIMMTEALTARVQTRMRDTRTHAKNPGNCRGSVQHVAMITRRPPAPRPPGSTTPPTCHTPA